MRRITERYVPENAVALTNEEAKTVVYLYEAYDKVVALAYSGKRMKPDFHYNYKTPEAREIAVNKYVDGKLKQIADKLAYKEEQKTRNKERFASVKIGDIFHSSWGYDQTNCDFYKLIELKGTKGTFMSIGNIDTERPSGYDSAYVKADVNGKTYGEPFTKLLKGDGFRISSFQYASKVEDPANKAFYSSWYA